MTEHRYPWKWRLADLSEPDGAAPTVFSTFACGGGSSMGYKRAGFRVVGNCEIDQKIAEVYAKNLHPKLSYVMDLRKFNELDDLPDELYHLDVLDGSPPCSTFSMAGSREKAWGIEKQFAEGQAKQRLDDLFFTYLDTVAKLRPKVFVAENVTGLLTGNAKGYVNEILKTAKGLGYDVQLFKLNAGFMGVPQTRERVFFVGNRMGYGRIRMKFDEKQVNFGDVRTERGVPISSPATKDLIEHWWRWGEKSLRDAFARKCGNPERNAFFNTRILYDNRPAYTMASTSVGMPIRACDRMHCSELDVLRIQSFPEDYDYNGDKKMLEFLCGMSVPPSMMANIAHEIRTQWLEA